ncbi:PREDICTED: piggyBac transposable element-derived protein 3-like [Priapulus caudatus]|uniref:PiggyBac transposable element-derived protein 3-like n=1 Tax=Priapulus caudatus TaxID=37621 RepID=A0ABM1ESE1_PRICU|nr:PREDICTED: piggyBac transposable element-derived protein 3-like [Priapulus caudatus]
MAKRVQTYSLNEVLDKVCADDSDFGSDLEDSDYDETYVAETGVDDIADSNGGTVYRKTECVSTCVKEIELVLGINFRMGVVEMPSVRMYRKNESRYGPVADVMSRNRFQTLLTLIHFVDNEAATDDDRKDKLWKIRPFVNMFREQCIQVTPKQQQSIDEMMVHYKGKFSKIRQYKKGKPHPWGFKVWARCSDSGLLHDFDIYQGKGGDKTKASEPGLGGDVIVKLCETLPKNKDYQVFGDNFFTSAGLLVKMRQLGFHYTGTVRKNRLAKCQLIGDKEIAKQG